MAKGDFIRLAVHLSNNTLNRWRRALVLVGMGTSILELLAASTALALRHKSATFLQMSMC